MPTCHMNILWSISKFHFRVCSVVIYISHKQFFQFQQSVVFVIAVLINNFQKDRLTIFLEIIIRIKWTMKKKSNTSATRIQQTRGTKQENTKIFFILPKQVELIIVSVLTRLFYQNASKYYFCWLSHVNPIQDGGEEGRAKRPPSYQFCPCNFYKRKNQRPKLFQF